MLKVSIFIAKGKIVNYRKENQKYQFLMIIRIRQGYFYYCFMSVTGHKELLQMIILLVIKLLINWSKIIPKQRLVKNFVEYFAEIREFLVSIPGFFKKPVLNGVIVTN